LEIKPVTYPPPLVKPVSKVDPIQKDKKRKTNFERILEEYKGGNINVKR
jgi:hypothetical protein